MFNFEMDIPQNYTLVCAAQALARSVFPVPGGPYSNTPWRGREGGREGWEEREGVNYMYKDQHYTPFGGCIPIFSNFSL